MIKILFEKRLSLNENRLPPREFLRKQGWVRQDSKEAVNDLHYPTGEDSFVEVMGNSNINFENPYNFSISVINMVPIRKGIYEEYIREMGLNHNTGLEEMKKHIAPGRVLNFGFVASKNKRLLNVLYVSVDGDEPRLFIRTLS